MPAQVAFLGVGGDLNLSDGIPDSSLHELLNVRVVVLLQISIIRRSGMSLVIMLRMVCAVGAHAAARLHDAKLGAGSGEVDGHHMMHHLQGMQPGRHAG